MLNLNTAQKLEDDRLQKLLDVAPLRPLESRRAQTEKETWDDAVSLSEIAQASRVLNQYYLRSFDGNGATATCLAVDSKLFFVGLSNSSILMFDHFGVTRGNLVQPQNPNCGGCSSLDSFQNVFLLSGYGDGRVLLWDASALSILRVIEPIKNGRAISFVRWVSTNTNAALSVDVDGVANLITFTKGFLLYNYSSESKLLLDGRSRQGYGPVLSCCILRTNNGPEVFGLALTLQRFTMVVRVDGETVKITYRWMHGISTDTIEQLEEEEENHNNRLALTYCLSYHPRALTCFNPSYPNHAIARCYNNKVEFLRLNPLLEVLPNSLVLKGNEEVTTNTTSSSSSEEIEITNSIIIACEWISDSSIALLTTNYQLQVLDTITKSVIGKCDASTVQLVRSLPPFVSPDFEHYSNSFRSLSDAGTNEWHYSLYLLGLGELVKVGIQPWNTRVDALIKSGQWLEALTLSLKYYRTVLEPLESGGNELKTNTLLMTAIRDGSKMADILKQYLVFQQDSLTSDVGAICVEYLVCIRRLDLIDEDVFEQFASKNKQDELMKVIFPFVLSGKIPDPSPTVLNSLLTYLGDQPNNEELFEILFVALRRVPFDLDGCLRICRDKRLLSSLCRLYNEGLNDFVAPVEIAVQWMNDSHKQREYGYRLLLYLSYCFLGVEFPRGNVPLSSLERCDLARVSLLSFFFPSHQQLNPSLLTLLKFDTEAFLKIIENARGIDEGEQICQCLMLAVNQQHVTHEEEEEENRFTPEQTKCVYEFVCHYVCHSIRRRGPNDSLLAILGEEFSKQLFEYAFFSVAQSGTKRSLTIELIERFPANSEWFRSHLPEVGHHHTSIQLMLNRMVLHQKENESLFNETLLLYLQSSDLNSYECFDFIREIKDVYKPPPPPLWLVDCLKKYAVDLLKLDAERASTLLLEIEPNVQILLSMLEPDPPSQFALLKSLIGARAFGEEITLNMVETFIRLLCLHQPDQAYDWLSKNEGRYSLDNALLVCQAHNIDDATAYLLERAGRVDESLNLVLQTVSKRMQALLVDVGNRESGIKRLEQSAVVVINLCVSFGRSKTSDEMWFRVLETFCVDSVMTKSTSHQQKQELLNIVEKIVNAMIPHVNLEKMLSKLSGHRIYNQFRPAIRGMLEAYKREATVFRVAMRALEHDVNSIQMKRKSYWARGLVVKATQVKFEEDGDNNPSNTTTTTTTTANVVPGFEDYEKLNMCWTSLAEGDTFRLSSNMLLGTRFEPIYLPPANEMK